MSPTDPAISFREWSAAANTIMTKAIITAFAHFTSIVQLLHFSSVSFGSVTRRLSDRISFRQFIFLLSSVSTTTRELMENNSQLVAGPDLTSV
jgi:hypothetical protein